MLGTTAESARRAEMREERARASEAFTCALYIAANGRRHGPMAGRQELASIARSKAVYTRDALGGLKTGWVVANSTGRQTDV